MPFLDRAVKLLLPREDSFFDLLERGAACAAESGELLVSLCESKTSDDRSAALTKLRAVEHKADAVIHETYEALNKTFVTPIDRADIFTLANDLEAIVDLAHATGMQIVVHAIDDLPSGGGELARLIQSAGNEVRAGVGLLRNMKGLDRIRDHAKKLSTLEHDGDEIYRARVAALFKEEKDAIRLIQHKEFLEGLESALDACDHVGTALTAVVIKNG